jgi:hypothetical protein
MFENKKLRKKSLPCVLITVLLLGLFVSINLILIPTVGATETNFIGCKDIGSNSYVLPANSLWFSAVTLTGTGESLDSMGMYFASSSGTINAYLSLYFGRFC